MDAIKNQKTTYRMGENVCKLCYLVRNLYPEGIKNTYVSNRNTAIKTWAMDRNSHVSIEDVQIPNNRMKRCTSLAISEI